MLLKNSVNCRLIWSPPRKFLAVDEVSAVIAHQLNEPLTALLIYLNEIKRGRPRRGGWGADADPVRDMVEKALRETERVCEVLERLGCATIRPGVGGLLVGSEAPPQKSEIAGDAPEAVVRQISDRFCLTPREVEVLALITSGTSNKGGGYQLGISTRTFEVHRAHIMKKLGAKNAADLVRIAIGKFTA